MKTKMKLLFLVITLLVGTHISSAQADSCGGENHVKHFEKRAENISHQSLYQGAFKA